MACGRGKEGEGEKENKLQFPLGEIAVPCCSQAFQFYITGLIFLFSYLFPHNMICIFTGTQYMAKLTALLYSSKVAKILQEYVLTLLTGAKTHF